MAPKTWQIDRAHSDIFFTVRHIVISKVDITIDAASIDTNEPKRDAHLRSADFLNAEKHPSLIFKSTKVEAKGKDKFLLHGDLTIRDVTKPVVLDVEHLGKAKDPWGQTKVLFSGKVSIQREDFGATWNQALEAGGVLVGKNVDIDIEIQAIAPTA